MMILITGSTGFVGQHVVEECSIRGHGVIAVARPLSEYKNIDSGQFGYIYCELLDLSVDHLKGIDLIIHLAASGVSSKEAPWPELLKVNILGTHHICHVASLARVPIVIAGSAKEYGLSGLMYEKIPVSAPLEPVTYHAASKAAAYLVASSIARTTSNPTTYLRIFNAYGPKQNPLSLWPSLYTSAIKGLDFRISSGSQLRDFIHVTRVASLIVTFGEMIRDAPDVLSVYNIGTGEGQTVSSFCEDWWDRLKAKGKIIKGAIPERIDDFDSCIADISNWPPCIQKI